nr:ABC transporter permease [Microbacterium thalassium]
MLDVIRWHYLLRLLVRTGVTTRYRNSLLGWTWSYVRPAAQFVVFWVVLGLFLALERGIPNYAVYLFSGIVIINLFTEAFKNATTSIVGNAALVRKVYLPRQLFGVSAVIVAFVHFLPQVVLLLVVCIVMGWITQVSLLGIAAIFAAVIIVMLLAFGLGLFFGALNVRYRDAENIVELLLLLVTWASPVLYFWTMVADVLPGWLTEVYMLNPITQAVELFHFAFWRPVTAGSASLADLPVPPGLAMNSALAFVVCLSTILIGQFVFRRLEGRFAQDL